MMRGWLRPRWSWDGGSGREFGREFGPEFGRDSGRDSGWDGLGRDDGALRSRPPRRRGSLERKAKAVADRWLKRRRSGGRPGGFRKAEPVWARWLRAAINAMCPSVHVCEGGTVCRVYP